MIRVEHLDFAVGDFQLRDITLHVRPGEHFVLLGEPGSGKTLLLECVAGLRQVRGGAITIDAERVEGVEPGRRGIGYVPQDYALFTTKSVRENIQFGLVVHRRPRPEREARVNELATMLGISHLLDRHTQGLSGGERQRVALARALALRPKTLLLDEPVSALDRETRDGILAELSRLKRETRVTVVHVCHDLDEMQSVADRVGILKRGVLVQTDVPAEVRRRPINAYVARLFGLGVVLRGVARTDGHRTNVDLGEFMVSARGAFEGTVDALIRAREVQLALKSSRADGLCGRVRSVLWRDATARVEVEIGSVRVRAEVARDPAEDHLLRDLEEVCVVIPPEAVHVLPQPPSNTA